MTPVLAVEDPDLARSMLSLVFGFVQLDNGHMAFGDQSVAVVRIGELPDGMLRSPLDHVAFSIPDADEACATFMARGGKLSRAFTPEGPKEILEFWDHGVRFVFFDGPDGWPMEFCMKKGAKGSGRHDHFAIRTADLSVKEAQLGLLGGVAVARHVLCTESGTVNVSFIAIGLRMFELFDEGPYPAIEPDRGWIGFIPTAQP